MKDRTFDSIPVIDISRLFSESLDDRKQVAKELGDAARDVGFLYVSGHQVSDKLISGLQETAKDFFAQSRDYKMDYYIGASETHKGYVPEGEECYVAGVKPDHKEAFDVGYEVPADNPLVKANTPLLGPNKWPTRPNFQKNIQEYYAAVFDLGKRLLQAFCLALGLDEHTFDNMAQFPPSKLRLIHYPYDEDRDGASVDAPGLGAHTDFEVLTLLLPDAPGLEVMNDKGEWIDAPPIPGTFVVNIGDMLEVLTAGQYVATTHRVRTVDQERYSFPLFYALDYNTLVQPLPQFAAKTADYEQLKIGDHMWNQALNAYKYLAAKVARGEVVPPAGVRGTGTFGNFKAAAAAAN